MNIQKKIQTALISVYYKDGLDEIISILNQQGVKIFSTGGTKEYIEKLGIEVTSIEDLTGYPSILGGRVKTLHPKIFGGILAKRDDKEHQSQLKEYEIPEIDLVIVDLYPFEETVASGAQFSEIIEKIDIGGISLIRAAAKNHKDAVIIASKEQYPELLDLLKNNNGETTFDDRLKFAAKAFAVSSGYDTAIFNWFNNFDYPAFRLSVNNKKNLRYGENPHQQGVFYGDFEKYFDQLHGKEISYNNLLDIDAAVSLIAEFEETTVAILKHNNACGMASRPTLVQAWKDALAGDPISAYGGIVISNVKIDVEAATEIDKLFFEVIIAPNYDEEVLEILKKKKNRIILLQKDNNLHKINVKTLLNGVLVQERDSKTENLTDLVTVTTTVPTDSEVEDLLFANKIVKHSKSNAIVLVKNKQLIGNGVGQTSRIDALKQAIAKAQSFNFELKGAVMASDAFFPFADCAEIAQKAGIKSIIQPGGSIRDNDTIDYCNINNISMVFTGIRHFKH